MPQPRKSVRQASKEALKQMQLLSHSAYEENDDDNEEDEDMDPTETFEIPSEEDEREDEEQEEVEAAPPKKKYRLSNRKSGDGQAVSDREVLVLKTVNNIVNNEELLTLDTWIEDLSEVQKAARIKLEEEYKELTTKIEQVTKSAEVIFQGEIHSAFELENSIPPLIYTTPDSKKKANALKTKTPPAQSLLIQTNKASNASNSYQLVMDPRLGLIVGTMTPTTHSSPSIPTQTPSKQIAPTTTTPSPAPSIPTRQTRQRGKSVLTPPPLIQQSTPPTKVAKTPTQPAPSSPAVSIRSIESPAITITPKGSQNKANSGKGSGTVVDLTSDENAARPQADSKEIAFNKLQGKTFPSLVVVARPHLSVKDISGGDRTKLDAKVKSVLMYVPTKFTEWLIQQGLVRSEQVCVNHASSKLKLGMYSDVSKFPYSGGYVWISECCPSRFVSVFSGSLFEGSSHPPSVILKLIYHWACQTNVQNVVQWVKVDNLYVKGINTLVRGICTAALHTHVPPLGGPGKRVEVGVISLGTTTQDGMQRQVKVEVLGVLESEPKHVRLRAIEPLMEVDRNYKKRFAKILEPLNEWVHKDSLIITDLTVDKQTLLSMGFMNVQQSTSTDTQSGNQTIMEYLRRIVPRMFQNTLSLLSRQIIQQFLDELVWREWYGTTAAQCFDNILLHISEQTRAELASGESLIMRLNKVAANPFKNWSFKTIPPKSTNNNKPTNQQIVDQTQNDSSLKKGLNRSTKKIINITTPDSSSPDRALRAISPDVPEQLVPLENYYYGTIEMLDTNSNIRQSWSMKCSMCKSTFSNNVKLMEHLFTHAHNVSGNLYQCQYCLSSVGSQEGLTKHIAVSHPLETKFMEGFVCIICEQRFANTFSLGKHLSKEHVPAELPYNCGTCSYRCSSHRQAIEHFYNKHDSGTTIQCPFCLKSTTIVSSGRILSQNLNFFLQHLQKHQKKALARKCPKCALWFINKDTLKEHQVNLHLSQRRKTGLVPWPVPRNGIMVPKSKTDKQVWEDSEREVDVSNISTNNLPSKLLCKECKSLLKSTGHFQSLGGCPNQNCQYETCCKNAMENHTAICKDLNASLPIFTLNKEMFCICGFSDTDGNTLAKHLAQCERKSAYPSAEIAKRAIKTHSMLDVLGLVRRPEEPLKSSSVVDLIDLEDDNVDQEKEANDENTEKKTTKKTAKRKRKAEDEIVSDIAGKQNEESNEERGIVQAKDANTENEVTQEIEEKKPAKRGRKRKTEEGIVTETSIKGNDGKEMVQDNEVIEINDDNKETEISQEKEEKRSTKKARKRKTEDDIVQNDVEYNNEIEVAQEMETSAVIEVSQETDVTDEKEETRTTKKTAKRKRKTEEEIVSEMSEKRKRGAVTNNLNTIKTRSRRNNIIEIDSTSEAGNEEEDANDIQLIESDVENTTNNLNESNKADSEKKLLDEESLMQTEDLALSSKDSPKISVSKEGSTQITDIIVLDDEEAENAQIDLDTSQEDAETETDVTVIENTITKQNEVDESSEMPHLKESMSVDKSCEVDEIEESEIQPNQISIADEERDTQTDEIQQHNETYTTADMINKENNPDTMAIENVEWDRTQESEEVDVQKDGLAFQPEEVRQDDDGVTQFLDHEHENEPNPNDTLEPGSAENKDSIEQDILDEQEAEVEKDGAQVMQTNLPEAEIENINAENKEETWVDINQKEEEHSIDLEHSVQPEKELVSTLDEIVDETSEVANQPESSEETFSLTEQQPEEHQQELSDTEKEPEKLNEDELSNELDQVEPDEVENLSRAEPTCEEFDQEQNETFREALETADEMPEEVLEPEELERETEEIEQESEDVHVETENIDMEMEYVCPETVPLDTEDVHLETENVHLENEDAHSESENVGPDTECLELDTEGIEPEPQTVDSDNECLDLGTEDVEPESKQMETVGSDIECLDLDTEDLDPEPKQMQNVNLATDCIDLDTEDIESDHKKIQTETDEDKCARFPDGANVEKLPSDMETAYTKLDQLEQNCAKESRTEDDMETALHLGERHETENLNKHSEVVIKETEEAQLEPEFSSESNGISPSNPECEEALQEVVQEPEEVLRETKQVDEDERGVTYLDDEVESESNVIHETNEVDQVESESDEICEPHEIESTKQGSIDNQQDLEPMHEPVLLSNAMHDNAEAVLNLLDQNSTEVINIDNNEMVHNSIDDDDVEENIENIQKELFGYQPKQALVEDRDAMDVDLPDIFEELGQNNTIGENAISNTAFDTGAMVADTTCFDSAMTGVETSDDNTKMLEEFIESIQTDTL